ncbi:hypothetical protein BsWGS_15579 [Bradybaena similaris]
MDILSGTCCSAGYQRPDQLASAVPVAGTVTMNNREVMNHVTHFCQQLGRLWRYLFSKLGTGVGGGGGGGNNEYMLVDDTDTTKSLRTSMSEFRIKCGSS